MVLLILASLLAHYLLWIWVKNGSCSFLTADGRRLTQMQEGISLF